MLNKSVLLLSGLVFGLSLGLNAFAGKKANEELDYEFKGPLNRYFKKVGKPNVRSTEKKTRIKMVENTRKDGNGYLPGSFKYINPMAKNSSDKAFLLRHQPAE